VAYRGGNKYIERLYVKCEGNRPLGKPRCTWDDFKGTLKK